MADRPGIPLLRPSLPPLEAYSAELEPVWDSRMLSNFGPMAERFEQICREYGGWTHVAASANCDLALTLAIAALEIPERSTVLLPSFTFNSTVHAVLWNRLEPRFVDVDPDTFCLDPDAVERAVDADVALVVGTHVFGAACDVEALTRIARAAGAALVFDAAHAFATFLDGRHVGHFGDASAFSFSGTKLVTSGEGGLAVFADGAAADRFRYLRAYGFRRDYESRFLGHNAKLSELHAALGILTVPTTEDAVAARQHLVDLYRERLEAVPGVRVQRVRPRERPSNTYFAVEVEGGHRGLSAHLRGAGIESKPYFRPLHEMKLFSGFASGDLPVTERLGRSVLCLPLFTELAESDVERVVEEIATYLRAIG